jgi:hypothetical protein
MSWREPMPPHARRRASTAAASATSCHNIDTIRREAGSASRSATGRAGAAAGPGHGAHAHPTHPARHGLPPRAPEDARLERPGAARVREGGFRVCRRSADGNSFVVMEFLAVWGELPGPLPCPSPSCPVL